MKILYFAWIKQRIGLGEETRALPPEVRTVADLVAYLTEQGEGYAAAFADPTALRAALDQEFCDLDAVLAEASEVALFPPVTGG